MPQRGAQQFRRGIGRFSSALPEAAERPGGEKGLYVAYTVRNKTFAYFTENHHGDG